MYFGSHIFYFESFSYGDGVFFGAGLHTPSGPVVSTAVVPTYLWNSLYTSVADPLFSNGMLAYRASTSSSIPDSLYLSDNSRIVGKGDPAPPGGTFSSIDANYGFNRGTVVFRGLYGSGEGIFTGVAGGTLNTIVKKGDSTPLGETFSTVLDPAISDSKVAFLGTFASGSGIFTGDGGPLLTVVKAGDATPGGGTFTSFSVPAIGGATLAFRGSHSGVEGIYTKMGAALKTVIEVGDPFFGSTLAGFNFSDLGLDPGGSGNMAFTYRLADGRTGVAMAVPGAGLPTIFQDAAGTIPVSDSVGIVFVPVPNFEGRNLTQAYLSGADLKAQTPATSTSRTRT